MVDLSPFLPSQGLLDAALDYARGGLPVFPCHPETKRPLSSNGFKDATTDENIIRSWWASHPNAMIGLPTGPRSGVWVLDIDDPEAFEAACPVAIPQTRRCDTGKGYHLYFEYDPASPVANAQRHKTRGWPFADLPGAEARGDGGYVIVPPSRHPSGRFSRWAPSAEPIRAPGDLLRLVTERRRSNDERDRNPVTREAPAADTPYGLRALEQECEAIRAAADGEQESSLNEAALKIGALVAGGELSPSTAKGRLIAAGLSMPSYNSRDRWTAEAIVAKVERGMADGAARPRSAPNRSERQAATVGHSSPSYAGEELGYVDEDGVWTAYGLDWGDPGAAVDEFPDLPGESGPDQWDGNKPPPREFVLDGWIARRAAGLLGGQDGVGKSLLAQLLATCGAAGAPFLGLPIIRQRAIYITCEDPTDEMHRRQESINASLGLTMADLKGWLKTYSLKGEIGNELAIFDSAGRMSPTPRYKQVREAALSFGAQLVFLDNAAHFFTGNENARHDVATFLGLLERLSIEINGAVILLAHPNKQHSQGNKQGNEYSGTTGWSAHVRNRLFLDWNAPDDGMPSDPDERVLRRSKANYAAKGEEILFRWHDWSFVRNEDLPADTGKQLAEGIRISSQNARFLECLKKVTEQGENVSHSSSAGNYAPKVFAAMSMAKGYKKNDFEQAMRRLLDLGVIRANEPVFQYPNRTWAKGLKLADEPAQNLAQNPAQRFAQGCTEGDLNSPEIAHNGCTEVHTTGGVDTTYQSGAALEAAAPDDDLDWGEGNGDDE